MKSVEALSSSGTKYALSPLGEDSTQKGLFVIVKPLGDHNFIGTWYVGRLSKRLINSKPPKRKTVSFGCVYFCKPEQSIW